MKYSKSFQFDFLINFYYNIYRKLRKIKFRKVGWL